MAQEKIHREANPKPRSVLDRVHTPADMKGLSTDELKTLCDDVRTHMIEAISKTGGHLGAGLGVVELTVALHAIFDTPEDKLIWDVGHQAYPHKILTGRKDQMSTIRQKDGLSGFTKRCESEYDPFGAGHSSTSISAALGMAKARDLQSKNNHTIAIIGDGAMSAGMAYEALNNAGHPNKDGEKTKLIIILNDNEMSIAPPVGALSRHLTKIVSSKSYIGAREAGKKITEFFPPTLRHAAKRAEEGARVAMGGGAFFEELGVYYIGPVDGHNLDNLLPVLKNVRDNNNHGPVLIHVKTEKGKGYLPAEAASDKMHGVKKFDIVTGDQLKAKSTAPSYTNVFAETLIKLAQEDETITAITAAMPGGTGLSKFACEFPERSFDVGIAEQHAVTFAAGQAAEGLKPFVAIYSTFLQRAYDQIIHDVAIQNLPVKFAIDRAGLVGADGQTHAGSFDIAYLGCIPNMVLMAPSDEAELVHMTATAARYNDGPIAFRYPRGNGTGADLPTQPEILEIGKGRIVYTTSSLHGSSVQSIDHTHKACDDEKGDIAILSYGTRLQECLKAAELLEAQGKSVTIADARFAKPLDEGLIRSLMTDHRLLITIEEGSHGGFGSYVLEFAAREDLLGACKIKTMHLPDAFQNHASPEEQYEDAGLVAKDLVASSL